LGDLRNKAKKLDEVAARDEAEDRRANGFTVFHFDLNPKLTRRDLKLGEAIRHLLRVTGTRMSFWRCPVRGLAVQFRKPPASSYSYDRGESWMLLHFSDAEDEAEAKRALVLDTLLTGIELYRGLPNMVFNDQVETLKGLLTAPPSVPADEWLTVLNQVHLKFRSLLRTHEADLRLHLLGQRAGGPAGPVALTARPRLEASQRRP
jgi:hypothetical protein